MKKLLLVFLLFAYISLQMFYNAQTTHAQELTAYTLPHPGIAPDHPLYLLKKIRDRGREIFTTETEDKMRLYILYADKHVGMAEIMFNKGKIKLAAETLDRGETYARKAAEILTEEKKKDKQIPFELVQQMRLSNKKHWEVIQSLTSALPQGSEALLEHAESINQKTAEMLKST